MTAGATPGGWTTAAERAMPIRGAATPVTLAKGWTWPIVANPLHGSQQLVLDAFVRVALGRPIEGSGRSARMPAPG
jgi:hypothetical protein